MTRIIGGTAGGRRLETPKGQTTRPTSDRVREALFSAIESWCGSLDGLRFLDLYAGSGAVGLEAWSRGAGVVTLVEQDRRTNEWDAQYRRAADISYRQLQLMAGPLYGVSWLDNFTLTDDQPTQNPQPRASERPNLMAGFDAGRPLLKEFET